MYSLKQAPARTVELQPSFEVTPPVVSSELAALPSAAAYAQAVAVAENCHAALARLVLTKGPGVKPGVVDSWLRSHDWLCVPVGVGALLSGVVALGSLFDRGMQWPITAAIASASIALGALTHYIGVADRRLSRAASRHAEYKFLVTDIQPVLAALHAASPEVQKLARPAIASELEAVRDSMSQKASFEATRMLAEIPAFDASSEPVQHRAAEAMRHAAELRQTSKGTDALLALRTIFTAASPDERKSLARLVGGVAFISEDTQLSHVTSLNEYLERGLRGDPPR